MLDKCILAVTIAASLMAVQPAFADDDADAAMLLERNKKLVAMKDKAEQLRLQAEMSKHYKEMEENRFYVDENGVPLGVPDVATLATTFRSSKTTAQTEDAEGDPFSNLGGYQGQAPAPDKQSIPVGMPLPESSRQDSQTSKSEIALVEVHANSIMVRTADGLTELRNGQSIAGYKLTRFDIDKAYLVDAKGLTKVISIDWSTSSRNMGR